MKTIKGKRGRSEIDDADDTEGGPEIKDLLQSLASKMDSLSASMNTMDKRLNDKMDSVESNFCSMIQNVRAELDTKLESLSTDIDRRILESSTVTTRNCEVTSNKVRGDVINRIDELCMRQNSRLDKLERFSLEKELIVSGIPLEPNDKPFVIVGDICNALKCNLTDRDVSAAYRLKSNAKNGPNRSVPIIIKFYEVWAKREMLSSYFKKKDLNLSDIGFHSSARIYVNEHLTQWNRNIFNLASAAKRANVIATFFTRNGLVFIQRSANSKPICIQNINDLEQILPSSFERGAKPAHHNNRANTRETNISNLTGNATFDTSPHVTVTKFSTDTSDGPSSSSNSAIPPNDQLVSNVVLDTSTTAVLQANPETIPSS